MTISKAEIEQYITWTDSFSEFAADVLDIPHEEAVFALSLPAVRYPILPYESRDTVVGWIVWRSLFKTSSIMCAHANMRHPAFTMDSIRSVLERVPQFARSKITSNNKTFLSFNNDSCVGFGSARTPDCFRGRTLTGVIFSGLDPDTEHYHRMIQYLQPFLRRFSTKIIGLLPKEK